MASIHSNQLIDQLNWRYATKTVLIPPAKSARTTGRRSLQFLLLLSPSSGGLQPWKFFVITAPGMRAKLKPASYGQAQISDASHLVVFAAKSDLSEADVDAHVKHVAEVRGAPIETLALWLRNTCWYRRTRQEHGRSGARRLGAQPSLHRPRGNLLTSAAFAGY